MSSFARKYANTHHNKIGQTYDGKEYDFHLNEVALVMRREKHHLPKSVLVIDAEAYKAIMADVSYLHDLIEDTKVSYEDILLWFGEEAADIVSIVSDPKDPALSRKEKKAFMNERFSKLDETKFVEWGALVLKAIDRMVNMRYSLLTGNKNMIKMYYKEQLEFRKAVFRDNIAVNVWKELDFMDEEISKKYNFTR